MRGEGPSLARRERSALVESMRAVGPDAPTLCAGWTTRDLAAHLVVREGRPDAAAGVVLPALADRLEALRLREAERPWEDLLASIDGGAPWYSPLRYADSLANTSEYLVHHEDVRRGRPGWVPRSFDADDLGRIWSLAATVAKAALRKAAVRVDMRTPPGLAMTNAGAITAGAALVPFVSVTAEPVELLLWAFGRDEVEVDISGAQKGIEIVSGIRRGL